MLSELLEKKKNLRKVGKKKKGKFKFSDKVVIEDWFEMNFEVWYSKLKSHTIETYFIDFSQERIQKFVARDKTTLKELAEAIDKIIKTKFKDQGCCFVKFSCRSPKDVTVDCPKFHERVKKELKLEKNKNLDDNDLSRILYNAHLEAMKVETGKEAVDLLLKSGRIKTDLEYALKSGTKTQLLIRKWEDIAISHEFRGFVYNKELTALSQYFDLLFFKELDKFKPKIVKDFYDENIKDAIDFKANFIIDFGITSKGKIVVIELNPFLPTTDSSCFNWIQDYSILKGEESKFCFRKRDFKMKKMKNIIIQPWKSFFK